MHKKNSVPENLTLSINTPSSMKMLGITSTVFCVLPALVLLGLFGTSYLDGTQAIIEAVNSFKMVDVVHYNNEVASALALVSRMEAIFAIGTALFMIHTGVFVEFHKRGVPQLMLAFVFGIAVFSHHQFITGGTHPWLEATSASVVSFLTPVRVIQGMYAPAMLLLALASFRVGHEQ
jgi:hypothetical protein